MELSDNVYHFLNFDIDTYLNPWIPHNRLSALPKPLTHFLGYRSSPPKEPPSALQWPVTFLATLAGLCLVGSIGRYAPGIDPWHPPILIASLGASAVLDFNTIKSPLAQPRNSIIGNVLAAICGVAISKAFQLNSDFANIQWVSGAVGCALASLVMSLTNTIHPPGGATAVLASVNSQVIAMGWRYVPIILLDSTLMICIALLFNNILRAYPTYWWTPGNVGRELRKEQREQEDVERGDAGDDEKGGAKEEFDSSDVSSERTLRRELSNRVDFVDGVDSIAISPYRIQMPSHISLSDAEIGLLERLQKRIRMHSEID